MTKSITFVVSMRVNNAVGLLVYLFQIDSDMLFVTIVMKNDML